MQSNPVFLQGLLRTPRFLLPLAPERPFTHATVPSSLAGPDLLLRGLFMRKRPREDTQTSETMLDKLLGLTGRILSVFKRPKTDAPESAHVPSSLSDEAVAEGFSLTGAAGRSEIAAVKGELDAAKVELSEGHGCPQVTPRAAGGRGASWRQRRKGARMLRTALATLRCAHAPQCQRGPFEAYCSLELRVGLFIAGL